MSEIKEALVWILDAEEVLLLEGVPNLTAQPAVAVSASISHELLETPLTNIIVSMFFSSAW